MAGAKNGLIAMLVIVIFCSAAGRADPAPENGLGACAPTYDTCKSAGFVADGADKGNGLWLGCINPIVRGTRSGSTAPGSAKMIPGPPAGAAEWGGVVQKCRAENSRFGTGQVGFVRTSASSNSPVESAIRYVAGVPTTFATHAELESYGFSWGPSDGLFGAIRRGSAVYTFFGTGGSTTACRGGSGVRSGVFTFSGNLDRLTGGDGCRKQFGPGDGPVGWTFDADYAGGGQVTRFAVGDKHGWFMPFHAEVWWKNPGTSDHKCTVGKGPSKVNCFYSSLGLAVSTDEGKTFKVVGEILQPSQPISAFKGGSHNMGVGYGSLIIADAKGKHLDSPPADPAKAYLYLFFKDSLPGLSGACAQGACMGVARALYADVVNAALSGDAHRVARIFRKYDGASTDSWIQPATSDTPDQSGTAGKFAPVWTDEAGGDEVIYDSVLDSYLAVYQSHGAIKLRVSTDLVQWSTPIGAPIQEPGRILFYPTLIGETGDPTVAGESPRLYFSSFPDGAFPNYKTAIFETVRLTLSRN